MQQEQCTRTCLWQSDGMAARPKRPVPLRMAPLAAQRLVVIVTKVNTPDACQVLWLHERGKQQPLLPCAEMVHAASASQRLFETPIPVSYTRHTSRSLMLWLLSLPFALWSIMGTSMVPACLVISYVSISTLHFSHERAQVTFLCARCHMIIPYCALTFPSPWSNTLHGEVEELWCHAGLDRDRRARHPGGYPVYRLAISASLLFPTPLSAFAGPTTAPLLAAMGLHSSYLQHQSPPSRSCSGVVWQKSD